MRSMLLLGLILVSSVLKAESPATVEELQREKVAVLKENYDVLSQLYTNGEATSVDVHNAHMSYLDGTLELAKTHQDRLKIHQDLVAVAEKLVKAQEQRLRNKEIGKSDLLRSRVMLLDRRIALAKEEQLGK